MQLTPEEWKARALRAEARLKALSESPVEVVKVDIAVEPEPVEHVAGAPCKPIGGNECQEVWG